MDHARRLGIHRSLEPLGSLPQPAWRVDSGPACGPDEIVIDVHRLNIDAASFTQMVAAARERLGWGPRQPLEPALEPAQRAELEAAVATAISQTVEQRGKMHNPVTGSGGMLTGTVLEVGPELAGQVDLRPGDRIATLVSLSLTPLHLERILAVHLDTDQVDVRGQAVLFASGLYARLPDDLPENLALAVLDVAGAPAQTAKLVKPGQRVVILGGGGKSGLLVTYEARKQAGPEGQIIVLDYGEASLERARQAGFADQVLRVDATRPVEAMTAVAAVTGGAMADVTINCVNVPGTEMASILATRGGGTVYFFSMATSFTAAALGAEGAGQDVTMIIGNGYTQGHADLAVNCLRESTTLRRMFAELYA
ncbi:MAG: L-erythro-3,5-diaminohexanoate dehydrogenase [Symbiobacteriia bacterium]